MSVRMMSRPGAACAALAAAVLLASAPAYGQGWGTIKGQVVLAGDTIPENKKANVDKDQGHCLSKGPILVNELVVNPKSKGVRWALVWITTPAPLTAASVKLPVPIHPSLKDVKPEVEIDQPCCVFEPRILGLREGQKLVLKNSAPIAHNFKIESGAGGGPSANPLIPAGGKTTLEGFKPTMIPTPYSCSIHAWMRGYIGTFPHPYFVVTDADGNFEIKNAPAGKFRLVVWHENPGWVIINPKNPKDRGKVIAIKAGDTTDVGKIMLTPSSN